MLPCMCYRISALQFGTSYGMLHADAVKSTYWGSCPSQFHEERTSALQTGLARAGEGPAHVAESPCTLAVLRKPFLGLGIYQSVTLCFYQSTVYLHTLYDYMYTRSDIPKPGQQRCIDAICIKRRKAHRGAAVPPFNLSHIENFRLARGSLPYMC